jgi:hypothetical protein
MAITGSVGWEYSAQLPTVDLLEDYGYRWGDCFLTSTGEIYRAVGDLQPSSDHVLVETRQQRRYGNPARVSGGRFLDGTPAPRLLPSVWVPLYGRQLQLLHVTASTTVVTGDVYVRDLFHTGPSNHQEDDLMNVIVDLVDLGVPLDRLGVQGSFARGTASAGSDIDIDVFGTNARVALAEGLEGAVRSPSSPWQREWPPRRRSVIDLLRLTGLTEWDDTKAFAFFTDPRRACYSYVRGHRPVSVFCHSFPRDFKQPSIRTTTSPPFTSADFTAQISIPTSPHTHREDPALATLTWAHDHNSGLTFNDVLVVSWSRAIWYCLDRDVIQLRAMRAELPTVQWLSVLPPATAGPVGRIGWLDLTVPDAVATRDFYRPYIRRDGTETHYLLAARAFTVAWAVVAYVIAIDPPGAIIDIFADRTTIMASALLVPVLVSLYWRRL